ncbi:hypothetical protein [Flavobacterium sp. ZS1P14]|uniref:hypothetical protein n=1 Tax=Flavobacterium sp. ZS1P14 TaxID=3401729 RepID=UPI003AAEA65E
MKSKWLVSQKEGLSKISQPLFLLVYPAWHYRVQKSIETAVCKSMHGRWRALGSKLFATSITTISYSIAQDSIEKINK